jgi:hypothetical protein
VTITVADAVRVVSEVKRAVIVAEPAVKAVTRPLPFTVATGVLDDVHWSCDDCAPALVDSWAVEPAVTVTWLGDMVSAAELLMIGWPLLMPAITGSVDRSPHAEKAAAAIARVIPERILMPFREEESVPARDIATGS